MNQLKLMIGNFYINFYKLGFLFGEEHNQRDAKWLGDIDEGITEFAKLLDWEEELENLMKESK